MSEWYFLLMLQASFTADCYGVLRSIGRWERSEERERGLKNRRQVERGNGEKMMIRLGRRKGEKNGEKMFRDTRVRKRRKKNKGRKG